MFHLLTKVPNDSCLAFSGGIDSLAAAHFFKRGKKSLTLLHFNHGCEYSDQIQNECMSLADQLDFHLVIQKLEGERNKSQSLEDFWRRNRYRFLRNYCIGHSKKLITVHHLDDAIETWIFSSLHGNGKLIPVQDDVVIRPFLTTKKELFKKYCLENNLKEVHDPFNQDLHVMRNYMRANLMEHAYHVNPGLDKVIRKKYLSEYCPNLKTT